MIRIGWAHYTITTIANPQNRVSVIIEAPIICFAALKRGRGSGGGVGVAFEMLFLCFRAYGI